MSKISLEIVECPHCDRSLEVERGDDAAMKRHVLFEHGRLDGPDGSTTTRTPSTE